MITVMFGGTAGIVGMIDASTMCRPSRPCTLPRWSTTAQSAPASPIEQVPRTWAYVVGAAMIASAIALSLTASGPGHCSSPA
jgi:hypothetical protein